MASLGWGKLAEALGIELDELKLYRQDTHAPTGRGLNAWLDYLGKFNDTGVVNLPGKNEYDKVVRKTKFSYSEGLVREKVREQMIVNQRRTLELDRERGKLLTKAEYDTAIINQYNALVSALNILLNVAPKDFLAAERPQVKKFARKWINKIKAAVKEELGKK